MIRNAAFHPERPWLALACGHAEDNVGAVLLLDVQAGTLLSVVPTDPSVGGDGAGLRWHRDGQRLAVTVGGNGIGVVEGQKWGGSAYPDESRDTPEEFVWVGDRIFTDSGALFAFVPGETLFKLPLQDAPTLIDIGWNESLRAVVGEDRHDLVAYRPDTKRTLYRVQLEDYGSGPPPDWAPGGQWGVRVVDGPEGRGLVFVDGNKGVVHGLRKTSSPQVSTWAWSPSGALAVSSYRHDPGTPQRPYAERIERRVDLYRSGEHVTTIELGARKIQASYSLAEASGGMAWSPTSDGVALLLDGQDVRIHDTSGATISEFAAPLPKLPPSFPDHFARASSTFAFTGGLLWGPHRRIVRIASHVVSVWSLSGEQIAEFVVPES